MNPLSFWGVFVLKSLFLDSLCFRGLLFLRGFFFKIFLFLGGFFFKVFLLNSLFFGGFLNYFF
ncbi:putative membrane protein [Helicobacter pylori Hp P-2]|uniref:Putative membrane protein n=1 Tax=Helicobacter pylori Hp P-2 TaxID=992073 RepID=J0EKH4_HELPX|nr:putative membrane protein [Helicobacter pylori Hp P-2]